jgi:hypothetical protein
LVVGIVTSLQFIKRGREAERQTGREKEVQVYASMVNWGTNERTRIVLRENVKVDV